VQKLSRVEIDRVSKSGHSLLEIPFEIAGQTALCPEQKKTISRSLNQ